MTEVLSPQNIMEIKPERDPDFIIGSIEDPYMLRWWLIPRNGVFNVYYHRVLRDDEDCALHDHPWPSFSILLKGRLREVTLSEPRVLFPGDCVYRSPEMAHRLELLDGEPAETLFITGPRVREWGFHCPKGFVHWKSFVAENPGEIGRGCGEMS